MLGNVVGSWIAYAVGYYGRLELLDKNRFIHINRKHLEWADSWFQRHGDVTVLVTRCLPIIRTFISLPAGVARMPFWRFTVLTLIGCIPWVLMLALIGREVGDNWEEWRDKLHYLDYAVIVDRDRRADLLADPPAAHPEARLIGVRGAAHAPGLGPSGRRSSGWSRGRPSCCRSRARRTWRWSRGSPGGTGARSTPRRARASRSPCTPARRRRC